MVIDSKKEGDLVKVTIKAARALQNMTQRELGLAVGKSEYTIANWESGKTVPRMDEFEDLCSALKVSRNNLILTMNQE